MGIKGPVAACRMDVLFVRRLMSCRIYKEIGPGDRIALSKLAVETFEREDRPLRIAIDISIWLFQIQSGKGEYGMATEWKEHQLTIGRWHQSGPTNVLL